MLQYADNTLFFCKAKSKSVFNLKVMLNCFELASGLKVNFSKSRLGGIGVEQTEILHFAKILNCEVMSIPFKYLGMPVGGCHKRGEFWDEVVNRVKKRLGRWKGRFISMAGRICLIKSVLSSIPLFYLSLFKIPSIVLKKIVSLQRNFLWGWGSDGRKIAWAAWDKVCKPKEAGGLGIINVRQFNLALMGKWIWRLKTEAGGLWKEVLESKYGGWRGLKEQRDNKSKVSLWWRDLRKVWRSEDWGGKFEDRLNLEVGNGREIMFWSDNWIVSEELKSTFPRLYGSWVSF
ncbi:uncharacterized mitochondrial protein AtMg00310-like [Phaseolus vulgaris]|uniref:uncharacterized mitochondrial protein AtMg00310-like n=1 Tax=Phaseolus vulgaris TaxID=3885 RepID=UPI0035CB082C